MRQIKDQGNGTFVLFTLKPFRLLFPIKVSSFANENSYWGIVNSREFLACQHPVGLIGG